MDDPAPSEATEAAAPTISSDTAAAGWEAPDVVGVLLLIGIIYLILKRCTAKSSTADRIAGLRTFFSVLDEDDEGYVDKDELHDAIEAEREARIAFAGATKEMFKADLRRLETEKKNKVSWAEFVAFVDKRLSNAASATRKSD